MIRLQERLVSSVTRFSWEFSGHRYTFFFVAFFAASARENHPTREKVTRGGERKMRPFLARGEFHARSRFTRSTIPEEKWGTTHSLDLTLICTPYKLTV